MIPESLAQEISLIALIILYSTVLAKLVPEKFHIALNALIAIIAILLGFGFGLSAEQMGIALNTITSGIFIAVIATILICIITVIMALIPPLRRFFIGDNLSNASGKLIAFETTIRIPFSTALIEEILFRGVLLGLLLAHNSQITALIVSSILFGLWHIFPTIKTIEQNKSTKKIIGNSKTKTGAGVLATIITTTIAGFIFGLLRIFAGSIIAPWLIHWSINASGVLGIYVAKKTTNFYKT